MLWDMQHRDTQRLRQGSPFAAPAQPSARSAAQSTASARRPADQCVGGLPGLVLPRLGEVAVSTTRGLRAATLPAPACTTGT